MQDGLGAHFGAVGGRGKWQHGRERGVRGCSQGAPKREICNGVQNSGCPGNIKNMGCPHPNKSELRDVTY